MLRRSLAHRKRAQTVVSIVAFDHLHDMQTQAIGSSIVSLVQGAALVAYDPTDPKQQWILTKA